MTNIVNLEELIQMDDLFLADQFRGKGAADFLGKNLEAWVVKLLKSYGIEGTQYIRGLVSPHAFLRGSVYVGENAVVEPTAMITGPCFIAPDAEIRHGAYIRGPAYIGRGAVVGHATEVKGSVFFDGAKAGHFAYVGDSILGREVNLGAGTKLANLKLRRSEVAVTHPTTGVRIGSGLQKLGSLVGDYAQTGCNAVLSPGTVLMPKTAVAACAHYVGTLKK